MIAFLLAAVLAQSPLPRVVIDTERGEIEVEIDTRRAPVTAENFLRYVRDGFYEGGRFYRTVTPENQPNDKIRIEVIQGGVNPFKMAGHSPGDYHAAYEPIALERTKDTGLKHVDGAISMARSTPDSATTEFFLCVGAQPELDFGGQRNPDGQGFAAFGRVVRGMDVVRAIQKAPREAQMLKPPVAIRSIRVAR